MNVRIPTMGKDLVEDIRMYLLECDQADSSDFLADCVMESYWRTTASGNDEAYEREVFEITVFLPVKKFRGLGEKTERIQSEIIEATKEYAFSTGRLIYKFEWQPYLKEEDKNKLQGKTKKMNWVQIFNRLFELINIQGETYYGGTRFLDTIREINYNVPSYAVYIEQRKTEGKSTVRKDYYYDLLMTQSESDRIQVVNSILDNVGQHQPERATIIRQLIQQGEPVQGPQAQIPQDMWNADRLIEYLERMDRSIGDGNYELTLTLAYTCLEGFFKSFIHEKIPSQTALTELTPMSVQIRNYIKTQLDANGIAYPDQLLPLLSTATNAICNARNNFSDSHSGNRAEKWVAVYLRDNVNSVVKLLLNFI